MSNLMYPQHLEEADRRWCKWVTKFPNNPDQEYNKNASLQFGSIPNASSPNRARIKGPSCITSLKISLLESNRP